MRFPHVDSLRAIAALSVFLFHAAGDGSPGRVLGAYTSRLNVGVTIFFVISGFLLYRPFVAGRLERGRPAPRPGRYAWHRFLRIVPAYVVALTVCAMWFDRRAVFGSDAIVYYGFGQVYSLHTQFGGISQAWTLSIEVAFYVFLPIWAWAVSQVPARTARARLRVEVVALVALFVFSAVYKPVIEGATGIDPRFHFALVYALPAYLDQFAVGMALAVGSVWFKERRSPRAIAVVEARPWVPWALAAVAMWALSTQIGLRPLNFAPESFGQKLEVHYLGALIAVGLMLPAVFGPPDRGMVRRILGNRTLRWVGVVSYGLYLWHLAVLTQLGRWGVPADVSGATGLSPVIVWICLGLVPSLMFAAASWYGIERTALRHKDDPAPAWLGRLKRKDGPGWTESARLGTIGVGCLLAFAILGTAIGSTGSQSAAIAAGRRSGPFIHIVVTYDSRRLRLYQDARLIGSASAAGRAGPAAAPIEIGSYLGGAKWSGQLKYVAVYRSALGPSEILRHYRAAAGGWLSYARAVLSAPGLASLWRDGAAIPIGHASGNPTSSRAFSLEAWVTANKVSNRVVVSRPSAWLLGTDVLGAWRATVFVAGKQIGVTSRVGPRPAGRGS